MTAGIKANSDGSAAIQVGGTDVITLTSGGAATFVTSPTTVQAGTAAAPSITFSGDTNTGIYSPGADTVGLTAGGTLVGSVGLGTTLALQGATSQSGTGITFPATQSASSNANTLDDYEEGTWTPTLSASGGTVTYVGQAGRYVKVGTQVTVSCYLIGYFSAGAGANNVTIGGLPFTTKNVTSPTALYHGSAFGLIEWIDWPADAKQFVVYANVNATTMVSNWSRDLAGSVVVTSNQWTNSSASLIFSMTYISE